MKNEKKPRNFWSTGEIRCMLDLIKDLQTKTGTTATTHHIFVQIQNEMARRGFRTKNAIQIRRKWFQMKSAYHCHKKGNNDRLLLIPEEFRDDIRDFVESESKGWWKIRKNEPMPEPGTCDWFNPNVTSNGDADDEAEQSTMDDFGEGDGEKYIPPHSFEFPPDIEIKPEPLEYNEMPEDQHLQQQEDEHEPTPGPSTSSPPQHTQQITFPMASVSTEFKKTKRKRKDIIYEQTPDMMQEKTDMDQEGTSESFPRSYQKKFLKFTNRCMSVEKTVQQEFLNQQWQLMKHEHKLQAERDQMIINSFQRATDEILEMSRTMFQNVFYNHHMNHDHLNK